MSATLRGRVSDPTDPAPPPLTRRPWPFWLTLALVVTAYWAGASVAFLGFGAPSIVVLFLPAGVTLSALVLNPRRRWPWILAAVAATEILVDLSHGMSPRWVWGFALANTAEPLVGALLLRRRVRGEVNLLSRHDFTAFLGCCVGAGPFVGGLIGATMLDLSIGLPWAQSFVSFWAGDATGVLTVAGGVLAWRYSRGRRPAAGRWFLGVALMVVATVAGFWQHEVPLFYLPLPVLSLLAFSEPLVVTLTAGMATTVTANLMTSTGHGPWAALDTSDQVRTLTLQIFLATTILSAWIVAIGVAERDSARSDTSVERAARLRLTALQTLTSDLARAATSDAVARAVVHQGVGLLADHGSLAILSPGGADVVLWATAGRPADIAQRYRRIPIDAVTPHTDAVRTGRRVLHQSQADIVAAYPHLAHAYRALDIHSSVCVPVRAGDAAPLGSLAFSFHREHGIDADVVAFAETMARLTGQALRRAQSYERQLDAAHQLQRALLPVLSDDLPGIRVSAEYRPADVAHEVGGDWYDVFPLPGRRIAFAVGDVVGHHLVAAAAMARLQSALRILAHTAPAPGRALDDLDRAGALIADSAMTTIGLADYDPASRVLRYACAGHPPPLLVTEDGAEFLWDGRSLPIGVGQTGRTQGERVMPERAVLVWYTDGLVERHHQHLMENMRRLADVAGALGTTNAEAVCRHLLHQMVGDETLRDDTAILCIEFTGGRPASGAATAPPVQAVDTGAPPP